MSWNVRGKRFAIIFVAGLSALGQARAQSPADKDLPPSLHLMSPTDPRAAFEVNRKKPALTEAELQRCMRVVQDLDREKIGFLKTKDELSKTAGALKERHKQLDADFSKSLSVEEERKARERGEQLNVETKEYNSVVMKRQNALAAYAKRSDDFNRDCSGRSYKTGIIQIRSSKGID